MGIYWNTSLLVLDGAMATMQSTNSNIHSYNLLFFKNFRQWKPMSNLLMFDDVCCLMMFDDVWWCLMMFDDVWWCLMISWNYEWMILFHLVSWNSRISIVIFHKSTDCVVHLAKYKCNSHLYFGSKSTIAVGVCNCCFWGQITIHWFAVNIRHDTRLWQHWFTAWWQSGQSMSSYKNVVTKEQVEDEISINNISTLFFNWKISVILLVSVINYLIDNN